MSKQIQEQLDVGKARIVDAPASLPNAPRHQVEVDRSFEIPTAYYGLTVGLYFAFLATMFVGFSSPGLVIPMVIFGVFILAGFGVPALWTRLKAENPSMPMTLGHFKNLGITTNTGRLAARDAAIQMLILPVLIVLWGCAAVTIAALV